MSLSQKIAILCPTRGNPDNIRRLINNHKEKSLCSEILFYFDKDDEKLEELKEIVKGYKIFVGESKGYAGSTNKLYDDNPGYSAYMMGADDMLFVTPGWDYMFSQYINAFEKLYGHRKCVLYGDDRVHGQTLCSFAVVSKEFCEAIGQFVPKGFTSQIYISKYFMLFGESTRSLVYCSKIIVEWVSLNANGGSLVVKLSECVHYCGFRYGNNEYNPYETYVIGLHNKVSLKKIRKEFINFLLHYRPRHLGEALGINLTKKYSLWAYPWQPGYKYSTGGWMSDPNDVPDILTHFSEKGILMFRIEEEFSWLERAYYQIKHKGYKPEVFKSPIEAITLHRNNGQCAHLLLDGNHRVSAMVALAYKNVSIVSSANVFERDVKKWPGVISGFFTEEDAIHIFNAYFDGNRAYITSRIKPKLILSAEF